MLNVENVLHILNRLTRSHLSKLKQCNCFEICFSLLTNSAPHLDWGWLITGLDSLGMEPSQTWSATLSLLLTKRPLFQDRFRQFVTVDVSPFQFTICSSASSEALLTDLPFFQLLRQSGNPWISLYSNADPGPGKEDNIFKFTVLWPPESIHIWDVNIEMIEIFQTGYQKYCKNWECCPVSFLIDWRNNEHVT